MQRGTDVPQQVDHELDRALARVEEFFDGVFAPLEAWLPRLREQLAAQLLDGRLTGTQLAALVEADAHAVLDTADRPVYGAGYCASDAVVAEGNPLAWWQGADRSLLASSTFGPGQAAIDLVRLEWYRVPEATGTRHIAGPFVDYLCSNEITITSAIPVEIDARFVGVICADVLVSALEDALHAELSCGVTLVNASGRVILSSEAEWQTGDRFPGVDPEQGLAGLTGAVSVVGSSRYPFALVAARERTGAA
ncbi:cache domain-containing protein [Leucobacter chromiireducens]|uniref:cache domain-containing protein n=1 Tax=Leucobacter chromiireducens TaxID=283877 RepID=UPI0013DDDB27|nr:cache domain-containing protein [Leucobacter chromiireducens]